MTKMTKDYFFETLRHSTYNAQNTLGRDTELLTFEEWFNLFLDWQDTFTEDNASLEPKYKTATINTEVTIVD